MKFNNQNIECEMIRVQNFVLYIFKYDCYTAMMRVHYEVTPDWHQNHGCVCVYPFNKIQARSGLCL